MTKINKLIKKMKKQYNKLGDTIKYLENKEEEKASFNQYIKRYRDKLAICGDKMLKCNKKGDLLYNNKNKNDYIDDIHYKETTLDKLKEGDIFIYVTNIEKPRLSAFNIFSGKGETFYWYYYLYKKGGVELIKTQYNLYGDSKVYKFLRN